MHKKEIFRFIFAMAVAVVCLSGFALAILQVVLDSGHHSLAHDHSVVFTPNDRFEWMLTVESSQDLNSTQLQSIFKNLQYQQSSNSIPFQLTDYTGHFESHSSTMGSSRFTKSVAKFLPDQNLGQINIIIQPDPTFPNARFAVRSIRPFTNTRIVVAIGLLIIGASAMLYCAVKVIRADLNKLKQLLSSA